MSGNIPPNSDSLHSAKEKETFQACIFSLVKYGGILDEGDRGRI